MPLKNAIEALGRYDGQYDEELSAHVTAYQSRENEVVLELEFVDAATGDFDRTERFVLTLMEDD
jgi:hypothetical protein